MVVMSLEELWSRLRGLRSEDLRSLSPEGLARVLGVDPRELPLTTRMELARRLYNEFSLPQRWIASRLRMSLRDVSRALKPKEELTRAPSSTSPVLGDPEVIAKAIKLIREGRARNPNDLVLELKVALDDAEELFNRIVENEKITNIKTVEAAARIARYVREVEKKFSRMEDLVKKAEDLEGKLKELIGEVEEKTKLLIEGIKYLRELQSIPALARTLNKWINEVQERIHERVVNEETRCVWIDDQGYCTNPKWRWHRRLEGEDMKPLTITTREGERTVYLMNMLKNPLLCPFCPYYRPRSQRTQYRIRYPPTP